MGDHLGDEIGARRRRAIPMPGRPLPALARRARTHGGRQGVADPGTLARYRNAWDHAANRTAHGRPIELTPDDFAR
jgi:hypothetical protein